jgi:hypothetical protein
LRFICSHCGARQVFIIPSDLRASHPGLFTVLSLFGFLRLPQKVSLQNSARKLLTFLLFAFILSALKLF